MRNTLSIGAVALALLAGCSLNEKDEAQVPSWDEHDHGDHDDSGGDGGGSGSGSGSATPDAGMASCLDVTPTGGALVYSTPLWDASYLDRARLAVDRNDDIYIVNGTLSKRGSDGSAHWSKAFGDHVATDAHGDVYVAGLFDRVIDFGAGPVRPHGDDGHAYLVKLDKDGNVLALHDELGLCGVQSVDALAVAIDGRVALTGTGLGTIVIDASGAVVLASGIVGLDLAFDAAGNLLVAGEAGGDGFLVRLDAAGTETLRVTFDEGAMADDRQAIVAVAVDGDGGIYLAGEFARTLHLYGEDHLVTGYEGGDLDGGFVVKLDRAGAAQWTDVFFAQDVADIALDPLGSVLVSKTGAGDRSPPYIPGYVKLDGVTGARIPGQPFEVGAGYGTAQGIAADSCANVVWLAHAVLNFPPEDTISKAFLTKLAL